ncbi:MAG: hypothetical protein ACOYLG_02935 [Chitinophagaceae bacterium]|jgi:hypothetical protein
MPFQHGDLLVTMQGTSGNDQMLSFYMGYFESLRKSCTQSEVSEIIDINQIKIIGNSKKVKNLLKRNGHSSFQFVHCLN